MKAIYLLARPNFEMIYPPNVRERIAGLLGYEPEYVSPGDDLAGRLAELGDTEAILSGWGGVPMDETFMRAMPNLKAVLYGAGSIKYMVSEAFWESGAIITSAWAVNAIPVAQFTVGQILMSLKGAWTLSRLMKDEQTTPLPAGLMHEFPGVHGSTVGIVSLGMIGRLVAELLRPFEVKTIAYDPFVTAEAAGALGVELCGLDDVFREADVVSLHTPWLPETVGMITGAHFRAMKKWSTFINTARQPVIRENELIDTLRERPDLTALLDVAHPQAGSVLYDLPNVVLTPHVAGASSDREIARMGFQVAEEVRRLLAGEPPQWGVTKKQAELMA